MSRNRKHKMTLKVKRIMAKLLRRQRIFEGYGGTEFTIVKGRKPGLSSLLHFDMEASTLQGTVTGRLSVGQPEIPDLVDLPWVHRNHLIHSKIAEQYSYADLEKRVAAMLGCDVSDIGQSIFIDRGCDMKKTIIGVVVQLELYRRAKAERDEKAKRDQALSNILAAAKKLDW